MAHMDEEARIANLRRRISTFPKSPGVYLMKDSSGRVLYIGKAKDLRARVSSYFQPSADLLNTRGPEIARMVTMVEDIDFLECETEVDALIKESRLIKDILPPHNAQLRDDKSFPYLEIVTSEDFPRVHLTRSPRQKGSKLYGPFTSAGALRDAINALQKVFKFRTCHLDIRAEDESRRFFRPCLLFAIDQCTAPCGDRVSKEAYRKDISRLRSLLSSKRSKLLRQLQKEMIQASDELRFEEAAVLRDRINAMQILSLSGSVNEDRQVEVFYVDPAEGLDRLAELLDLEERPRSIEGIDIANLQGTESVGSLVCFVDGRPFKPGYRRYQIKTVTGQDDYAMIREVIRRRYQYASTGEELYPDLILIDGGIGQLHAALEAFGELELRPPMVLSLAKKEELVYAQARSSPIKMAGNNPALRLLQQVRDEAHRFAQHYHHILRRKRVFENEANQGD